MTRSSQASTADALAQVGRALELQDKLVTLLSVKDPLSYQAVQAMHQPGLYAESTYDPSDEAEARRLEDREETLNGEDEREFLRSIGADFDD